MPAISALGRWSKKDPEFKVISLDYVRLPPQKEHIENNNIPYVTAFVLPQRKERTRHLSSRLDTILTE